MEVSVALRGRHILVTSGPTRADIDAVRYVSNRSSGRLGARIAAEALRRGARVTLVAGPDSARPGPDELTAEELTSLEVVDIETVDDLMAALEAELTGPDPPEAVVHAMAVLDYVPEQAAAEKVPSGREGWELRLVATPKVIRKIKDWAPDTLLVAFKLEVDQPQQELQRRALEALRAADADLAVANDLRLIRGERHPAVVLNPAGEVLARPQTKSEIAATLCDLLAAAL
jgi:phosphopantothenoylcysteine synthetase/decarboxylase